MHEVQSVNTRKRLAAMRNAGVIHDAGVTHDTKSLASPVCVVGPDRRCEHPLVDQDLNQRLYAYEQLIRGRFAVIIDTLKTLSAFQHELDFVTRAQQMALDHLGYELPVSLLSEAWVSGLNLRALHSYCIFRSFKECIDQASADQSLWRKRIALDSNFLRSCGYHTVDISPCADGRLQGLVPFVLRLVPDEAVNVKAYAGALFDIEGDVADWAYRELERLTGGLPNDDEERNYLKIAVYHFSSSNPSQQGCAAHGSNDMKAIEAALMRLKELRSAIDNTFGRGAAPDILLIGVDTDIEAIRIHVPDANGDVNPHRYIDSGDLYRNTLGMSAQASRVCITEAVCATECATGWAQGNGKMAEGMRRLVLGLLEANLSQIEYVIQYHAGRYAIIGHNERFICVGEAMSELQLRNKFYYAHLDTVEEGATDLDIGIKIFTGLNIRDGLPVSILVHFHYSSRVPGARERVIGRCRRVKAAIEARYSHLHEKGLLYCQIAISDHDITERCTFIDDVIKETVH